MIVVATALWAVKCQSGIGPRDRRVATLDRAGLFQRFVSAVLVDRLQPARGHAHAYKFLQLRHPDPMLVQIGREQSRHIFGHVPADAAFFLGHTTAVNDASAHGSRTGDGANFRHSEEIGGAKGAAHTRIVKRFLNGDGI
jgi:hypothetical protein